MECYTSRDLTSSYPQQEKKVFDKLTFSVEWGQFYLLRSLWVGTSPNISLESKIIFLE